MKRFNYQTPFGEIYIGETDGKISHLLFSDKLCGEIVETPLIKKTYKQLCEYFDGKRKVFDVPVIFDGTDFQIKVWKTLQTIEYGKTISYGQLAEMIGQPKASRAVGGANNKNKIAIIIPCHRVIGSNGTLTGYAGGLNVKKYLLNLEQIKQK